MSARNKLKEYIRQLIQKELKEASSTASAGDISYKTPYAFKKNKKGKKKKKAGYGGAHHDPTIGTDNFPANDPKLRKESVNEAKNLRDLNNSTAKNFASWKSDVLKLSKKLSNTEKSKVHKDITTLNKLVYNISKTFEKNLDESVNEAGMEIKKSKINLLKVNAKYTAEEIMDLYKELNNRDVDSELIVQYLDTIKDRVKMMRKNVGLRESAVNEGKYHDFRNDDTLSTKQKIGMAMRETRDSLKNLEKTIDMNVRLKKEMNVDSRDYWKNTHKALHKIGERLVKLAGKVGQLR